MMQSHPLGNIYSAKFFEVAVHKTLQYIKNASCSATASVHGMDCSSSKKYRKIRIVL